MLPVRLHGVLDVLCHILWKGCNIGSCFRVQQPHLPVVTHRSDKIQRQPKQAHLSFAFSWCARVLRPTSRARTQSNPDEWLSLSKKQQQQQRIATTTTTAVAKPSRSTFPIWQVAKKLATTTHPPPSNNNNNNDTKPQQYTNIAWHLVTGCHVRAQRAPRCRWWQGFQHLDRPAHANATGLMQQRNNSARSHARQRRLSSLA